jgi:hypothetical protein
MPAFKPKANKKIKICKRYSATLDSKHKEYMNEFSKYEIDIIPKLKYEKKELSEKIKQITNIEQLMEIKDRIKEINEEIKVLKNKKTDYFLENSKYIF